MGKDQKASGTGKEAQSGDGRVAAARALLLSSSFFHIYIAEVHWLLGTISRRLDTALKMLPPLPDEGGLITVQPEFHDEVDAALVSAARLRRLITVPKSPASGEKERHFTMRKARSQVLSEFFDGIALSEISKTGVRDTIEHLDEKLDQLAVKLMPQPAKVNAYAIHNMVVSGPEIFQILTFPDGERFTFRMYSQRDGTYYHGHERINIVTLGEQARAAFERIDAEMRKAQNVPEEEESRGAHIPFFALKRT